MEAKSPLRADATELYRPYEQVVNNWPELQQAINEFGDAYQHEQFVWRGQADARWPLTSALYRVVAEQLGRVPTEADLVAAEQRLLTLAKTEWRLDGIPALQLFARMQHVGAPTRLIDATLNPLIAAWFTVAADKDTDQEDGRLFAFTVKSTIHLNSMWNGNTPRWHPHAWATTPAEWGTGLGRRIWRPPALHSRIPAQSAAFLLDGVPVDGPPHALARIHPDVSSTWSAAELREFASIPVRLSRIGPLSRPMTKGLVFTYRISAAAKPAIRHQLEERFGYRFASIYADIEGLAEYLRRSPDKLVSD